MALLEIALVYLLANEGSALVDDPLDKGGLTRYGITQKTLGVYLGRPATREEVAAIDAHTVEDLYRKLYWVNVRGDDIKSQTVATALFDMAVLAGPARATMMAQKLVGAAADGLFGPKTLAAVNAAAPGTFVPLFSNSCCAYFTDIAVRDNTQIKWMPGWVKRAHRMTSLMAAKA